MVDLSKVSHHKAVEEITDLICSRVQNNDRGFFRPIVAYHLMTTAATMRAHMQTLDRGEIPVNGYVIALSTSGSGKGHSMAVLENEVFGDFRKTFTDFTLPLLAENSLVKLANQRAARNGTEEDHEFDKLTKEYENTGEYLFSFDEGHPSAIKQVRDKLLMARAGSINFVVDEIGSNLEKINPAMPLFLELYDQGLAKQKLYMNTNDRKRVAQIEGKTPANMLLFGTPMKLFDGGATEDLFYSYLETGYARRSIFALGHPQPAHHGATDAEIFDALCDPGQSSKMRDWADHLASLADASMYDWHIEVPRDVGIELLSYRHDCEDRANMLPEHSEIRKAELSHRYFKALKLAGAYAFIEQADVMTTTHLYAAMKLVEESGESFQSILQRERPYMKLARYIASCDAEVTHADLLEELPFYKSGVAARNEMLTMATAWGYKQHIIIKQRYMDGVEFLSGEALERTKLSELILSHSDDFASGYTFETAEFSQLEDLVKLPDYNWTAHAFKGNHRLADNAIPGFNLAVFDIDGTASLETVHDLLEDYVFMTHTTKRHTPSDNRFRLILPINYKLKLDQEDYREFMENLIGWLPFKVDEQAAKDIARKWATNEHAKIHYNTEGQILDVLPFIPRTKRNEERRKELKELGSLSALERWFAHRFMNGDRNNQMIRFALALVDSGMDYREVESKVIQFNSKLGNGLSEDELQKTVLVTVAKKLQGSP